MIAASVLFRRWRTERDVCSESGCWRAVMLLDEELRRQAARLIGYGC